MKRLLIYLTYDKQNIIDDYIGYFLHSMRSVVAYIAVVCNMQAIERGMYNLLDYADDIFYRENVGLDAGGFKDALCTFIGWEQIAQYDEIILANDSFYGPFAEIGNIFAEMESRNVDFWGLMKRGAGAYGVTGKDPEHILSFFYVFQAPLMHSETFQSYWNHMPYYKDYMTVVKQYERQLTKYFADMGYTYDAYADTSPNETANLKNQFFQCDYLSYEMIVKRNFPFLKRKQMSYNTLYYQTQENLMLSMEYIEKHIDYDVNLIWKNLIRTQHPTELQRSLGLQFILQDSMKEQRKHANAIVCVRVQWMNAVDAVCEYLDRIRTICDILMIIENKDLAERYSNRGFPVLVSKDSNMELLQCVDADQYQYICLLHDFDLSSEQLPSCSAKSYFYNIWENLIRNADYVDAIIELLETKRQVGMLMHPVPIFGTWLGKVGFEWTEKYAEVKEWLSKLHLSAVVNPDIPPINVTNNFWVKTEVITSFAAKLNFLPCENHIPEQICDYLWNYIVQDSMKLTGIVESVFYAAMNETNYHYYLKTFMNWMTQRYGQHLRLYEFEEIFHIQMAVERCREKHERWYVYGTGELAERCFEWIKDADAFIVSDGQPKNRSFHDKPILYLSELKADNEYGIVLCLSKENQDNVIDLLTQRQIKNYYVIH